MSGQTLAARVAATEATVARYRERPFDWAAGATCAHLARAQARAMGHRVPALGRLRSPLAARAVLRGLGHETFEGLLDSLFERVLPAAMLVGDLAMVEAEGEAGSDEAVFGAVFVFDGIDTLIGWHAADPSGLRPIKRAMGQVRAAWRL